MACIKEKPKVHFLVIDIETFISNKFIIQIAYETFDENANFIENKCIYINDGIHFNDYFKKISKRTIISKGVSPVIASKIITEDINNCNIIVGHNIKNFDIPTIEKYISQYDLKLKPDLKFFDTLCWSKNIVKCEDSLGRIKNPKLSELHEYLFKTDIINNDKLHDATYDVKITSKCFEKIIKENNILDYEYYKKYQ